MKKFLRTGLLIAVAALGTAFIISSFMKASQPPQTAHPPETTSAPVKIYGVLEPAGREVFISPPLTRRVVALHVGEGESINSGQLLAELENSIERTQVTLAEARIELARKAIELQDNDARRSQELFKQNIDSEYRYMQELLQKQLEELRLQVAQEELSLAQAELEQTMLRSPIEGTVYKFDIRLGETLQSGDNSRIILGEQGYWARMWVESFWRNRITPDSTYTLYDSETLQKIGTGTFLRQTPYMGRRDFRTEDMQERFDTKFQELILAVTPANAELPIGLTVLAELNR